MSLVYSLALGASLLAAPHIDGRKILDRYPTVALQKNWSAAVELELLVGPNGRVLDCTPIAAFGNEDFASMFCEIVGSVRAVPAKDLEGNPTYGVIRTTIRMLVPGTRQAELIEKLPDQTPDIELEVKSLPEISESSVRTSITVAVDEAGSVVGCHTKDQERRRYGEAACQEVSSMALPALVDKAGKLISYVRLLEVQFSLAGS
jgi:hypothetical protein